MVKDKAALTRFERDVLAMLDALERGMDPHVPVPHRNFVQINDCLLRKGMVTNTSGHGPWLTEAARTVLRTYPSTLPDRCYDGCR